MSHASKTAFAFACASALMLGGCAEMDAGPPTGANTYQMAAYMAAVEKSGVHSEADPSKKLVRNVSKPIGQTGAAAVAAAVGELVEIEVAASQGSATATVCYGENDQWDQDGPKCLPAQTIKDGIVTFRHIPVEPEIVTVYVTSQGAPEGTFKIATRGDFLTKGTDALARLERMNGKAYIFPIISDGLNIRGAVRYSTDVPGQRGRMWTEAEDGNLSERVLELDATGGLIWKQDKQTGPVRLTEDGTVQLYFSGSRIGYVVNEDGTVKKTVDKKAAQDGASTAVSAGVFKRDSVEIEQPAQPAQITAMMKEGPKRVAAARMKRMGDWGTLAQMEGRHWTFFVGGVERIGLYQWTIPGQQMSIRYWNADAYNIGKPDPQALLTHNDAKGEINAVYTQPSGGKTTSVFTRGPQGESIETTGARKDIYTLTNAGEVSVQHVPPAGQQAAPLQVRRAMDNNMVQIAMERTRAAQQRIAQQQAAARAAEEEEDDFNILGLLDATQQAYNLSNNRAAAVGALGNAFSPEVGSILQGAANSNAGSASGALAAGIDQTFRQSLNQAVPGIAPGGVGGGVGGPASGVAGLSGAAANIRNFAMGQQCPGFTNENYRQHAFQGGNDQQLFSLCGEAFELFYMTQNAIRQGYSEADWNRTYSAHKDAARVATDFYNNNRSR